MKRRRGKSEPRRLKALSPLEVSRFLERHHGLSVFREPFLRLQVSGEILCNLQMEELCDIGVGKQMQRRQLLRVVERERDIELQSEEDPPRAGTTELPIPIPRRRSPYRSVLLLSLFFFTVYMSNGAELCLSHDTTANYLLPLNLMRHLGVGPPVPNAAVATATATATATSTSTSTSSSPSPSTCTAATAATSGAVTAAGDSACVSNAETPSLRWRSRVWGTGLSRLWRGLTFRATEWPQLFDW